LDFWRTEVRFDGSVALCERHYTHIGSVFLPLPACKGPVGSGVQYKTHGIMISVDQPVVDLLLPTTVCSPPVLSEKVESQQIPHSRIDSIAMATLSEFKCEICGIVTENPMHWFVIECGDVKLSVHKWSAEAANGAGARHFCGERHAEVFISRWFDSVCVPPKRV